MSKIAAGLTQYCKDKLGTPYVYGAKGEVLTQATLDRLVREDPGTYTSTYKTKVVKHIGQHRTDCSGLINWYTGILRGSYNYRGTAVEWAGVGHLDEFMVGQVLWKSGHIGVYIGDGWCIEAKDINYGTIKSRVAAMPWQKALKLRDIDYTPAPATYTQGSQLAVDGQRWWYQFTDGSYATNGWYWLWEAMDGTCGWYLFDSEGYTLTGYQVGPAGEVFLLCPVKGSDEGKCVITNARGILRIVGEYDMVNRRHVFGW